MNDLGWTHIPYIDKKTNKIDDNSPEAWKYRIIWNSALFFVILPLNLQKRLATLRYFSMILFIIIMVTVFVAAVQSPSYYIQFHNNPDYQMDWFPREFKLRWLQGACTIMLAYNCMITFFYVRGEMQHKTAKRVKKVFTRLLGIECLFYLLICVCGYVGLGNNMTPNIFILRRKLSKY